MYSALYKRCLEEPFGVLHFATPAEQSVDPLGTLLKWRNHTGFLRNSYIRYYVEPFWVPPGTNFYYYFVIFIIILLFHPKALRGLIVKR